ncbi:MAG TPA: DNA polymerase domain-containing protein, partial [Isosphaeraceae bacterium]|nr:DNA polymerase domain-containing protein [Isosphaeraceae bacterium]
MIASFGIAPRSLGDCGAHLFAEILAERIKIKEQAATESNPAEATRLKTMAAGLKIVLNSVSGQMGNPYSVLYDPTSFLAVTLSGQLLLIDLLERLVGAGAEVLSVNTDCLFFRVRRTGDAWRGVLSDWQTDSGMTLETTEVQALVIEATNNYAVRYTDGSLKRRGTLGGEVSWKNVPNNLIVADAVLAGLLHGTLPEQSVRRCVDPAKFVNITRRDGAKVGVLVNDATGAETPLPRLTRWYKAKDSPFRIEHRWRVDGKEHKSTPPGASGVQLLMDLPDGPLGDIDIGWYVGEARERILANPDFPHLDPRWLADHPIAFDLYNRGLAPSPKWDGKKSPRGAKKDCPSFFWDWDRYDAFGVYTGPKTGVLVLDVDEPAKFRKWIGASAADLAGSLVSYHRQDSPDAVRSGAARGKLIFKFAADDSHPLARIGVAALRQALGIEVFYGQGTPTILGEHPEGPGQEYLLDGSLGPPPGWLLEGLIERASKKVPKPRRATPAPSGNGNGATSNPAAVAKYAKIALESEVARVAAAPEGERNNGLFAASCRVGELVGAGALDQETAEEALRQATTLPPDEAAATIRNGLSRGMECPRDLSRIHRNGDGVEPANEAVNDPHRLARLYRDDRCLHADKTPRLRYW